MLINGDGSRAQARKARSIDLLSVRVVWLKSGGA